MNIQKKWDTLKIIWIKLAKVYLWIIIHLKKYWEQKKKYFESEWIKSKKLRQKSIEENDWQRKVYGVLLRVDLQKIRKTRSQL